MGLFNTKATTHLTPELPDKKESADVKYDKPKILLIDLESGAFEALADTGFNVKEGTFGLPYKVPMTSGFQPLISTPRLPNYAEQEIVVVDLQFEIADQPVGEKNGPDGDLDLWGKCNYGVIDPRMRAAGIVKSDFDRILHAGGVFVVFAPNKTQGQTKIGRLQYRNFEAEKDCTWSEWSFISDLHDMEVSHDQGEEMSVVDLISPLGRLIKTHLSGGIVLVKFFRTDR
ncbi:hypothetical protein [Rhodoferax ferrireducens]|uniref:hypothetical protein n=1 Tax=Rhodoferax ferrireducens TaxID=192843 RepID=UPI000E0D515D|nr:hypothetical protein [Rhodoferax ferrireducens]